MLFDDVLQCAIPTSFFSFSMFFILVIIMIAQIKHVKYCAKVWSLIEGLKTRVA